MKTPEEMIDEYLTVQNGMLKGAKITPTQKMIKQLMLDYHQQNLRKELNKFALAQGLYSYDKEKIEKSVERFLKQE